MREKEFWDEVIRQIVHIVLGLLIIFFVLLLERNLILIILFIIFCASILFSLFITFFKSITKFSLVKYILNNLEREHIRIKFPLKGLIFFLAGSILTLKLFTTDIALASIVVLTFGDSVSTLTDLFGRAKYKVKPFGKFKTIYGTLLGIIVSILISLIFIHPFYAIIAAVFGMLAEAISIKLGEEEADDNFIMPVVAGTAVYIAKLIGI